MLWTSDTACRDTGDPAGGCYSDPFDGYAKSVSFYAELKRRNVIRIGIAYAVGGWVLVEVGDILLPTFNAPDWVMRALVMALVGGLPVALLAAWMFELSPEGIRKEDGVDTAEEAAFKSRSGRRADMIIMAVLGLAVTYFIFEKIWQSDIVRGEVVSIAVLAFDDMTPQSDQKYLSDGIAGEVLNLLARIPELRVISRSSSFTFLGKNIPLPEIAEKLNVAHILEGSVSKVGDRIRVTAQLIDARADTYMWSGSYDRSLDDVFAIQDDIAAAVVDKLEITLLNPMPTSRRTDPEAYSMTLKADQLLELRLPELTRRAGILLQRALDIDPEYVPAMHLMIRVIYLSRGDGLITREEEIQQLEIINDRILAVDPHDSIVRGYTAFYTYDFGRDPETAAREYQTIIQRDPNTWEVLRQAGGFARRTGFFDQSAALLERAVVLNPLCVNCRWNLKETYHAAGRLKDAERVELQYQSMGGNPGLHYGLLKLLQGKVDEAQAVFEGFALDSDHRNLGLAMVLHDQGNHAEFEIAVDKLIEKVGATDPMMIAQVYAYTGHADAAFEWLEKLRLSNERRMYLEVFSPFWHKLHEDPRWDPFRQKVGLSQERLAAIEFTVELPN